ncbi:hypothetical protein RCL1_003404 [Eukaryota sp. TZLM3-RCL]
MIPREHDLQFLEEAFYAQDTNTVVDKLPPNSLDFLFWKLNLLITRDVISTPEELELISKLKEHPSLNRGDRSILNRVDLLSRLKRWDTLSFEQKVETLNLIRNVLGLSDSLPKAPPSPVSTSSYHSSSASRFTPSVGTSHSASSTSSNVPQPTTSSNVVSFDLEKEALSKINDCLWSEFEPVAYPLVTSSIKKSNLDSFLCSIFSSTINFPLAVFPNASQLVSHFLSKDNSFYSYFEQLTISELKSCLNFKYYSADQVVMSIVEKMLPSENVSFEESTKFFYDLFAFASGLKSSSSKCHLYSLCFNHFLKLIDCTHFTASNIKKFIALYNETPSPRFNPRLPDSTSCYDVVRRSIIRCFILDSPPNPADFSAFTSEQAMIDLYCRSRAQRGFSIPPKFQSKMSSTVLTSALSEVELFFEEYTQQSFNHSQPATVTFSHQNTKAELRVYQIDLLESFLSGTFDISTTISLDGMLPSWSTFFSQPDTNILVTNSIEIPIISSEVRGLWIVDLVGESDSCRLLIKKGQLSLKIEPFENGQLVMVLDENGNLVDQSNLMVYCDSCLAQKSRDFSSCFFLPFVTEPKKSVIIAELDGYAVHENVERIVDSPKFSCGILIDQEQLIDASIAKALVFPQLTIGNVAINKSKLSNFLVNVTTRTFEGVSNLVSIPIKDVDNWDGIISFPVPNQILGLNINVSCSYLNIQDKILSLSNSKDFSFSAKPYDYGKITAFMKQLSAQSFLISLRGKSGEFLPNRGVTIYCKVNGFRNMLSNFTYTDLKGDVIVNVTSAQSIRVDCDGFSKTFPVIQASPQRTSHVFSSSFTLPLCGSSSNFSNIRLVRTAKFGSSSAVELVKSPVITDISEHNSVLKLNLKAGSYQLILSPKFNSPFSTGFITFDLLIIPEVIELPLNVVSSKLLSLTTSLSPSPLCLSSFSLTNQTLLFSISSPFVPSVYLVSNSNMGVNNVGDLPLSPPVISIDLFSRDSDLIGPVKRTDPEELQYVYKRRSQPPQIGCSLTTPSLLLAPRKTVTTVTNTIKAGGGSSFTSATMGGRPSRMYGVGMRAEQASRRMAMEMQYPEKLLYLSDQSNLIKLQPVKVENELYYFEINIKETHSLINLIAVNNVERATFSFPISPSSESPLSTVAIDSSLVLPPNCVESFISKPVLTNMTEVIANTLATRVNTFWHQLHLFDLFKQIGNNISDLNQLHFITNWKSFSVKEKVEKFTTNYCDELLLFVYLNDKEFFDYFVFPFISSSRGSPKSRILKAFILNNFDVLNFYSEISNFETLDGLDKIFIIVYLNNSNPDFAKNLLAKLKYEAQVNSNKSDNSSLMSTILSVDTLTEFVYTPIEVSSNSHNNSNISTQILKEKSRLGSCPIKVNRILIEFCQHLLTNGPSPFLPSDFLSISDDLSSSSLVLFFCIISLETGSSPLPPSHLKTPSEITLTFNSPSLFFKKYTRQAKEDEIELDSNVMVRQSITALEDPNQRPIKVGITGVNYRLSTVVSNLSSYPLSISVLSQIPKGSVPLEFSSILSKSTVIAPMKQASFYVPFYVPNEIFSEIFSSTVVSKGKLIGVAKQLEDVNFVSNISEMIGQEDSDLTFADILTLPFDSMISSLSKVSLYSAYLGGLLNYCYTIENYLEIIRILKNLNRFDPILWSKSLLFAQSSINSLNIVLPVIKDYLQSKNCINLHKLLSPIVDSELIKFDWLAVGPNSFAKKLNYFDLILKEYHPYTESRVFSFTPNKQIPNELFFNHYKSLLLNGILSGNIPDSVKIRVAFIQLQLGNVSRASELLSNIDRNNSIWNTLQMKYLSLILDYRNNESILPLGEELICHPIKRWRDRFVEVDSFARKTVATFEVSESVAEDLERLRRDKLSKQKNISLTLKQVNNEIFIQNIGISQVEILYWIIDLERQFSTNPTSIIDIKQFNPVTRAHMAEILTLEDSDQISQSKLIVPENLKNKTVIITANSKGFSDSILYIPSKLSISHLPGTSRLLIHRNKVPIPSAYVKVYSGTGSFICDSFSDLRGQVNVLFDSSVKSLLVFACTSSFVGVETVKI